MYSVDAGSYIHQLFRFADLLQGYTTSPYTTLKALKYTHQMLNFSENVCINFIDVMILPHAGKCRSLKDNSTGSFEVGKTDLGSFLFERSFRRGFHCYFSTEGQNCHISTNEEERYLIKIKLKKA